MRIFSYVFALNFLFACSDNKMDNNTVLTTQKESKKAIEIREKAIEIYNEINEINASSEENKNPSEGQNNDFPKINPLIKIDSFKGFLQEKAFYSFKKEWEKMENNRKELISSLNKQQLNKESKPNPIEAKKRIREFLNDYNSNLNKLKIDLVEKMLEEATKLFLHVKKLIDNNHTYYKHLKENINDKIENVQKMKDNDDYLTLVNGLTSTALKELKYEVDEKEGRLQDSLLEQYGSKKDPEEVTEIEDKLMEMLIFLNGATTISKNAESSSKTTSPLAPTNKLPRVKTE